jgi:N-acetylglucosaminyl-diphospho-decaprenol L-rhamnosyltransferase
VSTAAVVVVAYRKPAALDRLLGSVEPALPVLVVNVDDDLEVAAVARGHGRGPVVAVDNRGYAAGVNAGVRALPNDVDTVVFSNDDVEFAPGALRRLVDHAGSAPAAVAVPAVVGPDGTRRRTVAPAVSLRSLLVEWALLPDAPPRGLGRRGWVQRWRLPEAAEPVPGASGAVVAAPRRMLEDQPLPEAYFMYWEEREWFDRLAGRGATVTYLPSAVVVHHGGPADLRPDKQRLLVENAVLCTRRLHGRRTAAAAWPVVVLWQARLLAQTAVLAALGRRDATAMATRLAGARAALGAVRCVAWDRRPPA